MRDIRFRAWDDQRKEWITDCDLYMISTGGVYAGDVDNPPIIRIKKERVSFSTGLRDVNGKEIYEGDIVEVFRGTQTSVVKWNAQYGLFEIDLQVSGESELSGELLGNHLSVIEVVGNIYEHPHLLEEEERT